MKPFLITQSLLSAYAYMFDCFEGGEEDARTAFEQTLLRVKSPPTAAIQNGLDFEALVYGIASNTAPQAPFHRWYPGAKAIADRITGAQFQVRASRTLEIDGTQYLIYGVLDALRAGVIYDVKFKNKGFGSIWLAGNYRESPQHPFYFHIVPEAYEFQYLVSDGDDLYIETYHPDECKSPEQIIRPFLGWLESEGLMDTYRRLWVSK